MHHACLNNHIEIVSLLCVVEDVNVNAQDEYGDTPLHLAAENGHGECVKTLLAHKDINSGDFVIKDNQHIHQAEYSSLSDILQGILNCETFNDFTQIPHESFHLFMP